MRYVWAFVRLYGSQEWKESAYHGVRSLGKDLLILYNCVPDNCLWIISVIGDAFSIGGLVSPSFHIHLSQDFGGIIYRNI